MHISQICLIHNQHIKTTTKTATTYWKKLITQKLIEQKNQMKIYWALKRAQHRIYYHILPFHFEWKNFPILFQSNRYIQIYWEMSMSAQWPNAQNNCTLKKKNFKELYSIVKSSKVIRHFQRDFDVNHLDY